MAFLGAALRWPDALVGGDSPFAQSCEEIANYLRPYLPRPLNTLSTPFLVSLFFSWTLILSLTAASTILNQRRAHLVAPVSKSSDQSRSRIQRRPNQAVTTLLIGPEQTGKSSLYSALVFQAVPDTQTSQHENQTDVLVTGQGESQLAQQQLIRLVDLPGHPRLRGKANDYLSSADRIIFCVDTASAIKGGTSKNDTLVEAVDHFHSVLTTIARSRLSSRASSVVKSRPPPSLLVLFTRGDLSPLLSANAYDTKRQNQVVARARAAFEAELGRRRTGMGLGRGGQSAPRAKVGGMSKVVGGSGDGSSGPGSGWFGFLKSLVGFGSSSAPVGTGAEEDDDDEEDEQGLDYIDWAWSQRSNNTSDTPSSTSSSTSFNFDKLDAEVVTNGKAYFAVASLGKNRGWDIASAQEKTDADPANASLFPGLNQFTSWLVDPEL
ncbi:unnamed protein product [Sympodiomycopsis kandeliae]